MKKLKIQTKIQTLKKRIRKDLLLRAAACGFVLTVLLSFTGFSAQCAALENNVRRLHVIANSDTDADQAVKLRVRDAVLREAERWYGDAEDFDAAVAAVCTHLESLEAAANDVLRAEDVPYRATAEICEMYFPTRTYEAGKLPAGKYRTAHFARHGGGQELVVRRISGAVRAGRKRRRRPAGGYRGARERSGAL